MIIEIGEKDKNGLTFINYIDEGETTSFGFRNYEDARNAIRFAKFTVARLRDAMFPKNVRDINLKK